MHEIRWGIIGCGNVTEVKSGPAFNKVSDSKLVAVMRRDASKAKDYALRHSVPRWYDDAQQLIDDPEVNAIYVATPPSSHEQYALAAIKKGKPVYVEKPMSVDAPSSERITLAANTAGVKLCVAHYRREIPMFKKIKQILEAHPLGKLKFILLQFLQPADKASTGSWRLDPSISGGGLFHDLAPHQLDLMYHYFGEPLETSGTACNIKNFEEADNNVLATIRFGNDITFHGRWDFDCNPADAADICQIVGLHGSLEFSIFKMEQLLLKTKEGEQVFKFEPLQHVQQPMISEVVQYFLGRRENPCSGKEGVLVMKMIDEITRRKW